MLEFASYASIEIFQILHAARTADARRGRWLDAWRSAAADRRRAPARPIVAGSFMDAFA